MHEDGFLSMPWMAALENAMGYSGMDAVQVGWDMPVKLRFHSRWGATPNVGLRPYCESDETLVTGLVQGPCQHCRTGKSVQDTMAGWPHQSIYYRLAGYGSSNAVGRRGISGSIRPSGTWLASARGTSKRRRPRAVWLVQFDRGGRYY